MKINNNENSLRAINLLKKLMEIIKFTIYFNQLNRKRTFGYLSLKQKFLKKQKESNFAGANTKLAF